MKNTNKKLVGFYHYGVILTYLSVVAAIVGICFSVGGNKGARPDIGVICLLISGVCDAFDGAVAKTRKNRTREDRMFGERIDSLSDLIAFGVAPAMIGFGMRLNRWYFLPVYAVFVLCALIRLAYFDVTEELRTSEENCGRRLYYEGLPVTNVAFALPIFYLVAIMFAPHSIGRNAVMLTGYLALSAAFVIRFKMPKLGIKGLLIAMGILGEILGALLYINLAVLR